MYTLEEKHYTAPDGLSCRYLMPDVAQTNTYQILIVSFEGVYPEGSLGKAHGAYIAVMTLHGIHAFDPDAVVLDFRALDYRWGDGLLRVFQDITAVKDAEREPDEPFFPVVTVTSARSRAGLLSLITPVNAEPPDGHHTSLEEAIAHAVAAAKAWYDY